MRAVLIIATILCMNFNHAQSIELDSLKKLLNSANNDSSKLLLHNQLAEKYFNDGNYPFTLQHRLEIIDLKENINDTAHIGRDYVNLGRAHYFMRTDSLSNTKALSIFRKALKKSISNDDKVGIMSAYRGIGTILGEGLNGRTFTREGLDSCFIYLNSAMDIAIELHDSLSQSNLLSIIGSYRIASASIESNDALSLKSNNELKLAENDFIRAYEIAVLMDNWEAMGFALRKLSAIGHQKKNKSLALKYAKEALEIYQDHGQLDGQLNTYNLLTHIYKDLYTEPSDHSMLDSLHRMYQKIYDQIYNDRTAQAIIEVEEKYENEKKEQQIKILAAETELQELQIAQSRWIILGIVLISILLIAGVLLVNSRKRYELRIALAEEKDQLQRNRFKAVIDAEEKERKRIAQELHDGLGQILSTARLSISSLDEEEQNKNVQHSLKLLDSAVSETRTISHNMMPNSLVSIGLEAALKDLVRNVNQSGSIEAEIEMDQLPVIEESKTVAIYRIAQEVINNSLKYANATAIKVRIEVNEEIILTISDNGKGFDTSNIENSNGIGWKNIYSRASLINGVVAVFSKLGEGTTIKITLPLNESSKATTG